MQVLKFKNAKKWLGIWILFCSTSIMLTGVNHLKMAWKWWKQHPLLFIQRSKVQNYPGMSDPVVSKAHFFVSFFFFVQTVKPTSHRDSQGPQTFIHLGGNEEFLACIQISHFSMLYQQQTTAWHSLPRHWNMISTTNLHWNPEWTMMVKWTLHYKSSKSGN